MDVRPRDSHWPQDLPPVTVIGAGTMGRDIAATALYFGHETRLVDQDKDALSKAAGHVERRLQDRDRKGLLYDRVDKFTEGLTTSGDVQAALEGAGIVVESIPENLQAKRELFGEVAEGAGEAVLASNTSGLSIGEIADENPAAARIVGTHFFNPALVMPLVEVVPGPETDEATLDAATAFARGLGKEVVRLEKDEPGFVTTRVLDRLLTTCSQAVDEVDPSSIDAGFRELGFPMGPFEVMDLSGLDTVASVAEHLHGDVPARLKELVAEGHLGRKTGKGWYTSEGPDRRAEPADPWPLLAPALAEAAVVVDEGIASAPDVDRAMRLGASFPGGPFALVQEKGADEVAELAEEAGAEASALDKVDLPEAYRGLEVTKQDDLTHVRFTAGHKGNRLDEGLIEALGSALFDAGGAVIVSGEGRYFTHPKTDPLPHEVLEPLRKTESLALMHGPMGEGAMSVARACRRRVARIDSAIGTDRPVPAVRAVLLDLVDAVAHPAVVPRAVTQVLSRKLTGVLESQVQDLLYGR